MYSMSGWKRNLADLNVGRQYHACASYNDRYGHKVNITFTFYIFMEIIFQTYLVTGGFTGNETTKSTEIFTDGAWTEVGALPRARNGLRATNVNNMIYLLGEDLVVELSDLTALYRWRYRDTEI